MEKHKHVACPKYTLCCGNDKVQLPFLKHPPQILSYLLFNCDTPDTKKLQLQIQIYNMMFALTSPRVKSDKNLNNGRDPPTIRIQGQSCH